MIFHRLGVSAVGDGVPGHVPRAVAQPVTVPSKLPHVPGMRLGLPLAPLSDHGE